MKSKELEVRNSKEIEAKNSKELAYQSQSKSKEKTLEDLTKRLDSSKEKFQKVKYSKLISFFMIDQLLGVYFGQNVVKEKVVYIFTQMKFASKY